MTASGVGVAGAYNDSYPGAVAGAVTFNLGSGNSGWSTTPVLTAFPELAQPGSLTASPTSLSFGDVSSGSTSAAQQLRPDLHTAERGGREHQSGRVRR